MAERRALNALLSVDGYEGWELFCRAHGVTKSGLLDAFGRYLATIDSPTPLLRARIDEARATDAERRSRRQEDP
jgi:hypothetical protein